MMLNRFQFICGYAAMLMFVFAACASEGAGTKALEDDAVNELKKEVIAIHDEVMPKMADIERLKGEMEKAARNENLDADMQYVIQTTLTALEEGDSLMWNWMHNFSVPESSVDSMLGYLNEEKKRIEHVRSKMQESIREAEEVLQKLGHVEPH